MIWVLGFILSAIVLVILGRPLLAGEKSQQESPSERAAQLKMTIAQIQNDLDAGLIDPVPAEEAIEEAKRAALLLTDGQQAGIKVKWLRFASVGFLAFGPIVTAVIYSLVGTPLSLNPAPNEMIADNDFSTIAPSLVEINDMSPNDQQTAIVSMVEGLAARLAENPEDVEGWRMLARSYAALGEFDKCIEAMEQVLSRSQGTDQDLVNYSKVLIAKFGDIGDPDGRLKTVLEKILERRPNDPLSLYQLGTIARASGEPAGASQYWQRLLDQLPDDAPIRSNVMQLIEEADLEDIPK